MDAIYRQLYDNLQLPVAVCRDREPYELLYANDSAKMLLNPRLTLSRAVTPDARMTLSALLRFKNSGTMKSIQRLMDALGYLSDFVTTVSSFEKDMLPVAINANAVTTEDGRHFVLCIKRHEPMVRSSVIDSNSIISEIFLTTYNLPDADEAIGRILAIIGEFVGVSRAYIFEEIPGGLTRNSYEWCAEGIAPEIQNLQNLKKEEYNYDIIMSGGMYVTDDVRELPRGDFEILAAQNIKSLAILPLYHGEQGLGYIGFDDCAGYRRWTEGEIELLKYVSNIVVSLIERRDSARRLERSRAILRRISDSTDSIIYVSSLDEYKIIFANNAAGELMGLGSEELVGMSCWQLPHKDQTGVCDQCPLKQMLDGEGKVVQPTYTWEYKDPKNDRWYMAKDSIIRWIDGTSVHFGMATDITERKRQEERLEFFASVDVMTGAYNREWGYNILQDMMEETAHDPSVQISLCFVDIDGLKITNDTYGHDAGDEMITSIVDAIRSSIRKSDAICRWGGDEFLVLLRCETAVAVRLMERSQRTLERRNETGGRPYRLSFSFGVSEIRGGGEKTVDDIVAEADALMYRQKSEKRRQNTPEE